MVLIETSSWEPIKETDMQQFCVEMMKRLDIQRKNEQFCDVVLEVCKARIKLASTLTGSYYVLEAHFSTVLLTMTWKKAKKDLLD